MKCYFSFATAAIFCCGFSTSAVAQTHYRQVAQSPANHLVGIQVDSDESPLDFGFAPDESQPDPQSLASEKKTQVQNPVDSIIENSQQADRAKALTGTAAQAFTGTAAQGGGQVIDGSHFAPLMWSQGGYSHNALPDYMRLQWCADGLWDSFAAERAAQCALQYERISGARRHHCGNCGHAGVHAFSGHCCQSGHQCGLGRGCGSAGGHCGAAAGDCPPVNRYRLHRRHGCGACGQAQSTGCQSTGCQSAGCQSSGCETTGCGSCDQGNCDSGSHSILSSPITTSSSYPASGAAASQESTGKVAFLPLTGNR